MNTDQRHLTVAGRDCFAPPAVGGAHRTQGASGLRVEVCVHLGGGLTFGNPGYKELLDANAQLTETEVRWKQDLPTDHPGGDV